MAERPRDEKEQNEQRREENNHQEREEGWRRDPLGAIVWAAILIWAGLVFLAANLGLLAGFTLLEPWALIFVGAGAIIIVEVLIRLLVPAYRRSVIGSLIFAMILIAIGLGDIVNLTILLPAVLIAIGIAILLRALLGQR